jgi:hypothetical protein
MDLTKTDPTDLGTEILLLTETTGQSASNAADFIQENGFMPYEIQEEQTLVVNGKH